MKIIKYPTLPSTNTKAKELLLSGVREGVLLADKQTAGRGRLGRSFFSENGLFTSIILAPDKISFAPSFLTSAFAVAVCRTLREMGFAICIKWVNDLYLEGKKVCGILTEAVMNGNEILGYVVGIGINLDGAKFPEELAEIATAIPFPCEKKEELLWNILQNLDIVLHESTDSLVGYLTENSVVLGKYVRFFGAKEGEGLALRLDALGGLVIKTAENEILTLTTGEISLRIKN